MSWFVCLPLRESGVPGDVLGRDGAPTVGGKAQEGWGWGCIDVQGLLVLLCILLLWPPASSSVRVKAVTIIWIPLSVLLRVSFAGRQPQYHRGTYYQGSVPGSAQTGCYQNLKVGSSNQFYQPSRWFQCMLKFETRAWSLWNIRASHWKSSGVPLAERFPYPGKL